MSLPSNTNTSDYSKVQKAIKVGSLKEEKKEKNDWRGVVLFGLGISKERKISFKLSEKGDSGQGQMDTVKIGADFPPGMDLMKL